MAKNKKPVKKISRTKKIKETVVEVVQDNVQTETTAPVAPTKDGLFTKILKYGLGPALITGLLAMGPQLFDKAVAFYHNMSYEDYIIAQKQLRYWQKYASCINKDAFVISNKSAEIKLRLCDIGLFMTEFNNKAGVTTYTWLDLNIKELQPQQPQQTSRLTSSLYAQDRFIIPTQNRDNWSWAMERQQQRLLCSAENGNEMLYYVKKGADRCEIRKVNKVTGQVTVETIDCKKICKN